MPDADVSQPALADTTTLDVHDGHGPDDHGDAGGHGHPAHESEPLGPIDLAAWGYALAGAGLGLVVVIALYVAST
jgi:hypothetical protein